MRRPVRGRSEANIKRRVDDAQKGLKKSKITAEERHNLHCRIQDARALKGQADVISQNAIPVAYDNKQAKLDLIQKWPTQVKEIRQKLSRTALTRTGVGPTSRTSVFARSRRTSKDDIKLGQEAIRDLKQSGLMPKEVEDEAVIGYVKRVGQKVAANSDLRVPLQITVLNSKEINAFALPGGFVFIERGLLEAADDESQLAGVIAHEMSHAVARHGRKLMTKATIASLVYQAAQVAAVILTGGVAGIGTYYAIQYGFYGLGLTLSLTLLGVSRDFEQQADQLGIQYAWKAGYDTSGFIRFFDKMATKEGYVNGVSWFRSHPPFYQRMVESEREIMYLPKLPREIVNTTGFTAMKQALTKVSVKAEEESKERPSLIAPEQACPAPSKLVYEAGPTDRDDMLNAANYTRRQRARKIAALLAFVVLPAAAAVDPRLETVSIYLNVEKDGKLITGLTQGNFRLYEDGKAQQFVLEKPEEPASIALLVEYSRSSGYFIDDINAAMEGLLRHAPEGLLVRARDLFAHPGNSHRLHQANRVVDRCLLKARRLHVERDRYLRGCPRNARQDGAVAGAPHPDPDRLRHRHI